MEMHRMLLRRHDASILQHNLYSGAKLELQKFRPTSRLPEPPTHVSGVVKLHRRRGREIGGEDARLTLNVCLHQGIPPGKHERHIVDAGGQSGPVRALATRTVGIGTVDKPQPYREEQVVVNLGWYVHLGFEALHLGSECTGSVGVIEGR
ncbi:unnamed protein product [Linum tenue]|uniref:Uncharacterized protein n=1 Tax=Linum tenue TaxID=586396 RepID=A0AAV0ISN4_9ROSI|nr:unnamed protein product [Linum tenue]